MKCSRPDHQPHARSVCVPPLRIRAALKGLALAVTSLLAVATPASADGNVDLPRYPSISPDGSTIVFSWRGDLWRAPVDGGQATRLTSHPGREHDSYWTPDGSEIVFESDRDGTVNLWAMQPDGTGIRRITDLDTGAGLSGVGTGPDGDVRVAFSAYLEGDPHRSPRPYEVAIGGGEPTRHHDAFGSRAVRSPDGTRTVFERGNVRPQRRHYRGADRRDVWLHDESLGTFEKLTDWEGNDMTARWAGNDSVLFLSDRDGRTHNVHRLDLDSGEVEPLTSFEDIDVASFDVTPDGRRLVLHRWDTLHVLDLDDPNAVPRPIHLSAPEDALDDTEILNISSRVTEAAMNPDGKSIAVIAYGEVLVRGTGSDASTRRITNTHGRERDLAWSPDGTTLYFTAIDGGRSSIMAATVDRTRDELRTSHDEATADPEADADTDESEASEAEASEPAEKPEAEAEAEADLDDGISGTWDLMVAVPDMGEVPVTMELSRGEGGEVTGSVSSQLVNGSVRGTFDPETGRLDLELTIDEGGSSQLVLVIDGQQVSGTGTTPDGNGLAQVSGTRTSTGDDEALDASAPDAEETEDAEDPEEVEKDPMLAPARWADAVSFVVEPFLVDDDGVAVHRPSPSPDGMSMAFVRGVGDLVIRDLATSEDRLLRAGWDRGIEWRWSSDSRWIVFDQADLNFNQDVFVVPADGSAAPINISRHPDNDGGARFSGDARILAYASERNDEEYDMYLVFLDRELEKLAEPELDAYFEAQEKAAKARKPLDPDKVRRELERRRAVAAGEIEDEEADEDSEVDPPFTTEDLETAYRRVRQVTNLPGRSSSLELVPAGDTILFNYSTSAPDASGLHSVAWNGGSRKRLGGTVSMMGLTLDGTKLVAVDGGQAQTVAVAGGKVSRYPVSQRIRIDLERQSSEKFLEAAAIMGENFYHPTMKGLDWDALSDRYHDLARRTRTADEFNWVGNRLLGELSSSHQGIRAPAESLGARETIGRLGVRVEPTESGYRVVSTTPDGPAEASDTPLLVGDEIVAIEFDPFDLQASPPDTLASMLRGRNGKETVVSVRRPVEDGEPVELDLLLEPISRGAESMLVYREMQRRRAALVEEWSDGRLGYAHIRGMSQPSLDEFERDIFAAADGKDGLLIDVRDNGGGWTTDRLLSSIMVRPHAYTVPRGADSSDTSGYPQDRLFIQRYTLPINMLCNEKSYSNAEIISHAFKTLGRGTLVGQETHGSVISTGGTSLIDGTTLRLPFRGWYLPDGTDMENNGAVPDIVVEQTPESEVEGDDLQLRAAVEDLIRRIDAENP